MIEARWPNDAGDPPIVLVGHSWRAAARPAAPSRPPWPACSRWPRAAATGATITPRCAATCLYFWHALVPLGTAPFGYFPGGRRFGKVGDLPRGVVPQWRRWCMHPRYHVGAEGDAVVRALEAARFPVVALSITDDELMTERGTHQLVDCYANAPRRASSAIAPHEVQARRIVTSASSGEQ